MGKGVQLKVRYRAINKKKHKCKFVFKKIMIFKIAQVPESLVKE